MKCKKVEKEILDFIEGNIDIKEKEEIEKHLVECECCQRLYSDFMFILHNSKKIGIPTVNENLWKAKLNFIVERSEIVLRSFKPIFISISILILVFSTIFFTKNYLPQSKKVLPVLNVPIKIDVFNHELPLPEDEMIKYADYMEEEEAEKVLDLIFADL